MPMWELIVEAMTGERERGRDWLRRREVIAAVVALAPGTHEGSLSATISAHCINDPGKRNYVGLLYRRNPLLITDDPTLRGKRYRLLTDEERAVFINNTRDDLERFSYLQVVEWLRAPSLPLDQEAATDELAVEPELDGLEINGPLLLEMHLQDYLYRRWSEVFPHLRLYNGSEGKEYITRDPNVGIIDFLCTNESGNFVVIETKRNVPDRQAIGQVLGYMGWVAERLAEGDASRVSGMLIAGEATDALQMSVAAVPNLDLWVYEVAFSLRRDQRQPRP